MALWTPRGEQRRGGDERRDDQRRPHEGKPIPNSKRDGSCLRLRYGCCNGALWGTAAQMAKRAISPLFADDLDQHPLAATAVELAIKNLPPGTEAEVARRNSDHDLSVHDLLFHMGIWRGHCHVEQL